MEKLIKGKEDVKLKTNCYSDAEHQSKLATL